MVRFGLPVKDSVYLFRMLAELINVINWCFNRLVPLVLLLGQQHKLLVPFLLALVLLVQLGILLLALVLLQIPLLLLPLLPTCSPPLYISIYFLYR